MGLELIELVPIFMVFILYFLGMPIVYALFGSTFFYFTFIDTTSKNWLILQKVMTSTQSFSMLAIPFFVMAGSVMNYGGINGDHRDFVRTDLKLKSGNSIHYSASTIIAAPRPPAAQAVTKPNPPPRRRSSCSVWVIIRAPVAAKG